VLVAGLVLGAGLLLAACGSDSTGEAQAAPTTPAPVTVTSTQPARSLGATPTPR
jgi:ABC-type glycerol-3-phosphate transport system substrate-binding protein